MDTILFCKFCRFYFFSSDSGRTALIVVSTISLRLTLRPRSPIPPVINQFKRSQALLQNYRRFTGPRDIYDVDALVLREATTAAASAGKHHAHGVASFHLSGMLDQSRQLVEAYSSSRHGNNGDESASATVPASPPPLLSGTAPRLKIRSEVCQRKRREIPKGGVDDWHLTDEERFVRWPGAYLDAGSTLGIRRVTVVHEVHARVRVARGNSAQLVEQASRLSLLTNTDAFGNDAVLVWRVHCTIPGMIYTLTLVLVQFR